MIKKIGILTSGGDCAGLNAVLRAATTRAIEGYGWQIYGIRYGTMGLLSRPVDAVELTIPMLEGHTLRMGGTILGTTNKGNPMSFPMPDGSVRDRSAEFAEGCRLLGLDALIGIGGDGSLAILRELCLRADIPMVAIPKTIDNDLDKTESAIGFETAVEVATEALDRLQPTAASHNRVMVLEVMGRDAGHIALSAGIAGGADVILVPEIPYSMESIARKIKSLFSRGHTFALVIVAEAVRDGANQSMEIADPSGRKRYGGISHYLADSITEITGAETRFMALGHTQRGAEPCAFDRILAASFGVRAVDFIAKGKFDHMVAWQNREVVAIPILEAIAKPRLVDPNDTLVKTARGLGICLGDD
ncbi:MAG: ATP-dependent 6-phosphofructokinase [Holosporales bacterium]